MPKKKKLSKSIKTIESSLKRRGYKRAETRIDVFHKDATTLEEARRIYERFKGRVYFQVRAKAEVIKLRKEDRPISFEKDKDIKAELSEFISTEGYFMYEEMCEELYRMLEEYEIKYEDLESLDIFILIQ